MDGAETCVITETQLAEPATAPEPVGFYGVNEERDHCRINAVGGELCAFCHSAGNDGGGSGAENKVENEGGGPGEALKGLG